MVSSTCVSPLDFGIILCYLKPNRIFLPLLFLEYFGRIPNVSIRHQFNLHLPGIDFFRGKVSPVISVVDCHSLVRFVKLICPPRSGVLHGNYGCCELFGKRMVTSKVVWTHCVKWQRKYRALL